MPRPGLFSSHHTVAQLPHVLTAYTFREIVFVSHLEPEILRYLTERATAQGTSLNALVNRLLRKDIELIEAGK